MTKAAKIIDASCLILAGGKGERLTSDKPLLKIGGVPIIERAARVVGPLFREVLIVTNTPEKYEFLHLPLVADERPGCGPLMGIYSGLCRIGCDAAFVCAADMPFLSEAVIRAEFAALGDFDIVVPWPRRRPQFLHAIYRRRCLPAIAENLDADQYKIETLATRCKTRRLNGDWFERNRLTEGLDSAFTNINTAADYFRWGGRQKGGGGPDGSEILTIQPEGAGTVLASVDAGVLHEIRRTLIDQETAYQKESAEAGFSSLWAHSSRVGRIAHRIAAEEGLEPEPALLAGLLHDTGKFASGSYHEDDVPEEENAAGRAERILTGTVYERWIPIVKEAILCTYLDGEATGGVAKAVYDADCLDKLGNIGVAQFFAKKALRRQFLNDEVLIRTSIELTYAYHAPDTLKTATGRSLAKERSARTHRFYTELLEEWRQLGLGSFVIRKEEIAGIVCFFVVPAACSCGARLALESDIQDSVKCRQVVANYRCRACLFDSTFSFCLPNVNGLPVKR